MQIEALTKSFGERVLFENVALSIEQGEKVALIAANGAGKTTLLGIISGSMDYQSGSVTFRRDIRVGYLEQNPQYAPTMSVIDACFSSSGGVSEVIKEYEKALSSGENLGEAMAQMDATSAWDYEQQAKEILTKLNITDFDQPIGELSGGQVKRVALASVLISKPDILILDEPTNHLDLQMTEWLEEYLLKTRLTLLIVTHDRYFLDRVCDRIVEIDNRQIYSYGGNYSYYLEKREERIELGNLMAEKTRNLYKRELEWIRRTPSARTGKAKYRVDAFDDLSTKRRSTQKSKQVNIGINSSRIGTKIFEMIGLQKSYGPKLILKDFNYLFSRGEKLGIVGVNGVGKSTFIKMLLGEVPQDSGVVDIGETVRFGYYSQSGLEFNDEDKVIDVIKRISEDIAMSDGSRLTASQFLQQFLFSPSSQHDFVAKLSGGERRRLYLCSILISNPNFLILDEPTNDLDIETLNVLEEYLSSYKGCLIVISHDRYFLSKTTEHLFIMEGEGVIKDFPGTYSEYKEWREAEDAEVANRAKTDKAIEIVDTKPTKKSTNRFTFNEKREFELIESELPELELRKTELESSMSNGAMSAEEIQVASLDIAQLIEEIESKTMRWLELSEKEG